jgi:hypothetical protein
MTVLVLLQCFLDAGTVRDQHIGEGLEKRRALLAAWIGILGKSLLLCLE